MSANVLTFAGFLGSRSAPVPGARIELADASGREVLASTLSNESGAYRLELRLEVDPALFSRVAAGAWRVRAVSADGRLLAERPRRTCKPGGACITDLQVTASALGRFKAFGQALPRLSGGLLDDGPLRLIEAAIEQHLAPKGTRSFDFYSDLARRARPPIYAFGRLLDDAWGVLDGHPGAARALRGSLSLILGAPQKVSAEYAVDRGRAVLARCGCGTTAKPDPARLTPPMLAEPGQRLARAAVPRSDTAHRTMAAPVTGLALSNAACILDLERMIPVYAATFRIARDDADLAQLVGSLEFGLCGLGWFDGLLTAATEALASGDARGLRGRLDYEGGEFDPDGPGGPPPRGPEPYCPDPPFPEPVEPPGSRCDLERFGCMDQLRTLGGIPGSTSPPYIVTSISDIRACPGATITILGSNFGTVPGLVCFPFGSYSPGGTCVQALSWTDTEIRVVVPAGAGAGELYLSILESTYYVCGKFFGVTRNGAGNRLFLGGRAAISSLTVNAGRPCTEPGTTVPVTWVASNGGAGTTTRLRINSGSSVLLDQSGLADRGSLDFTVPSVAAETTLTFTLDASNACGNASATTSLLITVVPALTIAGVELTQGIQTFAIGGAGNNALPTIAGKDTIVRVYVSCDRKGFLNDECQDVSAVLRIGGTELAPINGTSPTNPGGSNPFITAGRLALIDRTQTNHTLNFRIPAALARGNQQLDIRVFGPAMCGRMPQARTFLNWSWVDEPALKIRFVRVRDNRAGGTGTQPTDRQSRFTIDRAFDLLPSPPTDIAQARRPELFTTDDFTTLDGLGDLLDEIDDRHNCSAWDWLGQAFGADCPPDDHALWIGLTVPFNRGLAYRPGNSAVAAIHTLPGGQGEIQRTTPAHELAHNLDFMHVNRLCSGSIGGPFYSHPNNGDLQQVPFDPFWNVAIGGTVQDFMSYGCTVWTSEDSWARLRGAI